MSIIASIAQLVKTEPIPETKLQRAKRVHTRLLEQTKSLAFRYSLAPSIATYDRIETLAKRADRVYRYVGAIIRENARLEAEQEAAK